MKLNERGAVGVVLAVVGFVFFVSAMFYGAKHQGYVDSKVVKVEAAK